MIADLRSDTVTKPTKEMRAFMMQAEVGDDVFGEDPSINALEEKIKSVFGTEAAMFCPTATMANQIAIKILTNPLDEIICDRISHIYVYEVGGYAFHSGCSIRYVNGQRGVFTAQDVLSNINPVDVHKPITSLVCIENTMNRGGGKIFPMENIREIEAVCRKNDLKLHLDGSRLFNALIASGDEPKDFGNIFDTISLCFSKGLGCPVGAILTGKEKYLAKARRVRKVFGGGMRQAGILASACIYALDNHLQRMAEDHQHANRIYDALKQVNYCESILATETNIVIFKLKSEVNDEAFIDYLAKNGVFAFAIGDNWVRFVTHIDISPEMMDQLVLPAIRNFK